MKDRTETLQDLTRYAEKEDLDLALILLLTVQAEPPRGVEAPAEEAPEALPGHFYPH